MPDPVSLSAVGIMALAEGVKFLYAEASAAIKLWRDKKARQVAEAPAAVAPFAPAAVPAAAFEGKVTPAAPDLQAVETLEESLVAARKDVADVADGIEIIDTGNAELLAKIDALRRLMEPVLSQRLTFKGEKRPPSGPLVRGDVQLDELKAYAAGVRARTIRSGEVSGSARAKTVGDGGQLFGVDAGDIG